MQNHSNSNNHDNNSNSNYNSYMQIHRMFGTSIRGHWFIVRVSFHDSILLVAQAARLHHPIRAASARKSANNMVSANMVSTLPTLLHAGPGGPLGNT